MLQIAILFCMGFVGEWSQFRGNNSDAHAVNVQVPMEWSDSKNVDWKIKIPGLGWSSPVLVDDQIFVTTAVAQGEGLSLRAISIDAKTGATLWDQEIQSVAKAPSIHSKNSHASPTPIVRDGSVFVHFGTLGTARLDASTGKIRWICNELDYPPMHGSGGSPVLRDGKLVIVCDGSTNPFVCAINAETGKLAWKTPRSVQAKISHSFVTVNIAEVDGKPQVLAPGPDHFAAYDLQTGHELWRVMAPGWSVCPQPVLFEDLVIYNHDYDNPELMAVKLGGKGDVTESNIVWKSQRGAPSTPTPLLIGGDLYFVSDNGVASCVDAKTGQRHWMERLGGNYSASPVYVNGLVLFMNETGVATWIQPKQTFQVVGKNEVSGRTFATPGFSTDAMYLRTDEHLLKIRTSTP